MCVCGYVRKCVLISKACAEGRDHTSFSTAHFLFETVFQGTCSSMFGLCWLSQSPQAPPGCLSAPGLSVHTTMLDFSMDSGSPNSDPHKYFTCQVIFPVPETPPSPKQNRTKCLTDSKAVFLLQPTPSEGRNIRAETPPAGRVLPCGGSQMRSPLRASNRGRPSEKHKLSCPTGYTALLLVTHST